MKMVKFTMVSQEVEPARIAEARLISKPTSVGADGGGSAAAILTAETKTGE